MGKKKEGDEDDLKNKNSKSKTTKTKKTKTKNKTKKSKIANEASHVDETKKPKRLTLDELEAISSDEEEDSSGRGTRTRTTTTTTTTATNNKWNAEAEALKQSIEDGDFDQLIQKYEDATRKKKKQLEEEKNRKKNRRGKRGQDEDGDEKEGDDDEDTSFEEIVVGDTESENDINDFEDEDEDEEEEEEEEEEDFEEVEEEMEDDDDDDDDDDEQEETNKEKENETKTTTKSPPTTDSILAKCQTMIENHKQLNSSSKALLAITSELLASKRHLPWMETCDVIPSSPLPFGKMDETSQTKISIHDDLKREVAFYNLALEAVQMAQEKYRQYQVPFTRPDDFFAEMVKTDEHMAKVKDRLIFENKKIEAVAQRKANREQKLRSREARANKVAEKAKRKKQNLQAMQDWAMQQNNDNYYDAANDANNNNNNNRKRKGWIDRDGTLQFGPNKKRMAADKKYGGSQYARRGRFKQNDPKSMNDMSSFNTKGNFEGGMKHSSGSTHHKKRPGKRARDANRTRR